MNITVLSGNMAKDAEVKTTTSGKKVARFTVAVRSGGTDKSDFFNCVAWEKKAEFIENGKKDGRYLSGCDVELKGQFHNVSFDSTDPQTGVTTKVKYDELTIEDSFSRRHKNWQGGAQQDGQQAPQGGYQQQGGYQTPQGGYQQPQRGGYQPPQQGGYQQAPAPQPQGGYQQTSAPQPQGGYQAVAPQQAGYQQAPAPQPQQGGYQAAPPTSQPPVQTGSFQQIPAQNAAAQAPAQAGGFKAAAVNAPRSGQASYGGYPEGAGYGN